jgi:metal-dependent hydrolase (beta-lactamase superfamily II)
MMGKCFYRVHEGQGVYSEYYKEISAEEYETYCAGIAEKGFALQKEHVWGASVFRFYAKENDLYIVSYYPNRSEMLAVSEPNSNWFRYTDNAGKDRTTSLLRQVELDDFGESYVIRLRDGRLLVFDGGFESESDADNLMHTLTEFSPDDKPCIAAWIMTHPHLDHYRCFLVFEKKYGTQVEIEKFIYNFPDTGVEEYEAIPGLTRYEEAAYLEKFYALVKKVGAPVYRAHTGQIFQIGNAKLEILSSPDNTLEAPVKDFNQLSLVIRMEIEGQVILWAGDAYFGKAKLAKRYGDYLKSDIFQIPHHGFQGGEEATYDLIRPDVCLICGFDRVWLGSEFHFYELSYNQHLIYEMDVQEYLAGGNGNITLELPYFPQGNGKEALRERIAKWRKENGENHHN